MDSVLNYYSDNNNMISDLTLSELIVGVDFVMLVSTQITMQSLQCPTNMIGLYPTNGESGLTSDQ